MYQVAVSVLADSSHNEDWESLCEQALLIWDRYETEVLRTELRNALVTVWGKAEANHEANAEYVLRECGFVRFWKWRN